LYFADLNYNLENKANLIPMWKNFFVITLRSIKKNKLFNLINIDGKMAGEEFKGAYTSPVTAPVFKDEIPEIENYCRFNYNNNLLMWVDPAICLHYE
jgi:hypothetical protein